MTAFPILQFGTSRFLQAHVDLFVSQALARVNLKTICADNPVTALKRRTGARFDLIILDIEMPDASGFDLCSRFRTMPGCRDTPIIFLSVHRNHEDRTESVLRGGSDYVTKPFLYTELAAKALSFVIRGPLKSDHATNAQTGNGADAVFSRRDLNVLKQSILGRYGG